MPYNKVNRLLSVEEKRPFYLFSLCKWGRNGFDGDIET